MEKRYDKIKTYYRENLYIVIPMCITALFFDGLMCFVPLLEGRVINLLKSGEYQLVLRYSLLFIGLVLFIQFNRFCKRYLVRVFGNKMSLRMRSISLRNLLAQDLRYFKNNNAGDILNRNLSDIYDTTEGVRKMTTEVFDTLVLLLGYLISMFVMDVKITLIVSIFIALSIVVAQLMQKIVYKITKDYKEYMSKHKQLTLTILNNEIAYRGFGVMSNYEQRYQQSVEKLRRKNFFALVFQSSLEPLYSCAAFLGIGFIAYFGGIKVMNGVYEIGVLSAYLTTFLLVAKKAAKVGKVFNSYQGFKVSWIRCKGYLQDVSGKIPSIAPASNELCLTDFTLGYQDGFQLPTINLKATTSDVIGICGRVHTGKSTLLKGLTGLYDYHGLATFGGISLENLARMPELVINYCPNDVAIFNDTLENNITLNRQGDLSQAIDIAQLNSDISSMGGLNAKLSHSMANISGGQQKRLQVARTLYPIPRVVLLDDPFQSVEAKVAEKMLMSLNTLDQTLKIVVSNNPMILQQTTQIIYLEEEALIGDYQTLLANPGFRALMEVH